MGNDASPPVEMMLERLDKVRKNGNHGWVARCPAHEDKSASLSVCEGAGGRVLVNCFAGCSALDVVQSLGMTLAQLFPVRVNDNMTREEVAELHATAMRSKWAAALAVIDQEALVVFMVANKAAKGIKIGEATMKRVTVAAGRISQARIILKTGPAKRRLDIFRPKRGEGK